MLKYSIHIYNKILYFKDEKINFIFDTNNIAQILEYKDRNDVLKNM
jgi:hypothetical protein